MDWKCPRTPISRRSQVSFKGMDMKMGAVSVSDPCCRHFEGLTVDETQALNSLSSRIEEVVLF